MSKNNWTKAEDRIMKRLYAKQSTESIVLVLNRSLRSVYSRANTLGLKKLAAYLNSHSSGRLTPNSAAGFNTRFKKGNVSFNKGLKQIEYMTEVAIKKTVSTRFKKGLKPHNTKPISTIEKRADKSGKVYLYIKLSDKNWQLYQRYVWEMYHGIISPGHIIRFKDKNTFNCDIDNLVMISKADNMRQNSIHRYPTEIKEVMRLQGKLVRTIIKKQQNGKG